MNAPHEDHNMIGLGEVVRTLSRLEKAVDGFGAKVDRLEEKFVARSIYELDVSSIKHRLDKIEAGAESNRRAALTGLIFPIAVLIIWAVITQELGG